MAGMSNVSTPESPKRQSAASAPRGHPPLWAAADQGKKRLPTFFRCRQLLFQQREAAEQQFHLLKAELQQWLAAIQFAWTCELEGESGEVHGVTQLKPVGGSAADFEAGSDAAQQPAIEGIGFGLTLGPHGLELPVPHQVSGGQS